MQRTLLVGTDPYRPKVTYLGKAVIGACVHVVRSRGSISQVTVLVIMQDSNLKKFHSLRIFKIV